MGGLGDSGTRAIRFISKTVGLRICDQRTNEAGDAMQFHHRVFKHRSSIDIVVCGSRGAETMYCPAVLPGFVTAEHRSLMVQIRVVERLLYRCILDSSSASGGRLQHLAETPWGFKNPKSIFFLPALDAAFSPARLRFVLVVRDPRDVSLGDNQHQYEQLCRKVLLGDKYSNSSSSSTLSGRPLQWVSPSSSSSAPTTAPTARSLGATAGAPSPALACFPRQAAPTIASSAPSFLSRLLFWSRVNLAAVAWAALRLGSQRFMVFRIEDVSLARDPLPAIARLASFMGLNASTVQLIRRKEIRTNEIEGTAGDNGGADMVKMLLGGLRGHRNTFKGRGFPADVKRRALHTQQTFREEQGDGEIRRAFTTFRYEWDKWKPQSPQREAASSAGAAYATSWAV